MSGRVNRTQSFIRAVRYSFKTLKGYKYVNDYNNTTQKECVQYDDDNNYLYEKNVTLYNRTVKMLEKRNAIFGLPEPPRKPRTPSNIELFIIFKRRKEKTDNKLQTLAVIYLLRKGYHLVIDPDVSVLGSLKYAFEPYQAIELAEKVSSECNENYIKNMMDYVNENKIYLTDEPQDKSVSQKIRFYNDQNVLFRKKSNASIGSRERCNSDTYVIEQKLNENKLKETVNSNRCNTVSSMATSEAARNNMQPSVIIQMGGGVSSSDIPRHKSNPYISHDLQYNRNSVSSPLAQPMQMQIPAPSAPLISNNSEKLNFTKQTEGGSIPPAYYS